MSRRLLFECVVDECGHLLQLWVDGSELHAHVECDNCRAIILEAVEANFGRIPVTVEP